MAPQDSTADKLFFPTASLPTDGLDQGNSRQFLQRFYQQSSILYFDLNTDTATHVSRFQHHRRRRPVRPGMAVAAASAPRAHGLAARDADTARRSRRPPPAGAPFRVHARERLVPGPFAIRSFGPCLSARSAPDGARGRSHLARAGADCGVPGDGFELLQEGFALVSAATRRGALLTRDASMYICS